MESSSYSSGPSSTPLLTETIGANLDRTAAEHPGRDALVDVPSGRRWTYSEFLADVELLAAGLLVAGVGTGDRVGIWAPNCPEWVLTQYATAKIGAILVNINPAYRTHELGFVLKQAGVSLLLSAQEFKGSDYAAMIEEARTDAQALRQVVFVGSFGWELMTDRGHRALAENPRMVAEVQDRLTADDPINIQYTSGTTGFPKGATLSHRNILNNGYFVGELCHYTADDRVCVPVPFYHCFGMVMGNLACTSHGAAMIIPSPAFDPVATLEAVQTEKCTSLYGVPTMFIAELAVPEFESFDLFKN